MKKIIFLIIAMLIGVFGGIFGWYYWQNEDIYPETAERQDPYMDMQSFDEIEESSNYISWNDFTWNGPDATNEYIEEMGSGLLSRYSNNFPINPNTVNYYILRLTYPEYAMDLDNKKMPDSEVTQKLLFNNIICFTGRKNDLLIAMYSRFRSVIFKVISNERFYELEIPDLIRYLDEAYNFYYRNGYADTRRLQNVYDALCNNEDKDWIHDKMRRIAEEENLPVPSYTDDEDEYDYNNVLDIDKLLLAYSFWARRHGENNISAVKAIVDDLRAHYMYDEEQDLHIDVLNHEDLPTDKNGDYIYYYYRDNDLICEYKYDMHGQRTGYWIEYFLNKKNIECRMENDMIHGEYNKYDDGRLIESYLLDNDLLTSGVFYDEDGNIEKSIRYEYEDNKLIEHIDMGDEGTVSSLIINNQKEGPYIAKYPDGQIKIETNYSKGRIDGEYKKYYPSGKIQEESFYERGTLNRIQKIYHENGNIKTEINYDGGAQNGDYKEYYPSGNIKTYRLYRKNILTDIWYEYYESGQIKSENMIKDDRVMETKYYHENGKVSSICKLVNTNNREALCKGFDEDENPLYEISFIGNKKHGNAITYYPSGKVKEVCVYNNDKPEGIYKTFYEDGKPEWVIPYETGERNGEATKYYNSEKINKTLNYENGKLNGLETNYLENGFIESEISWQNDKRHGIYHLYYPSGNVKEKGNFKDDKPDGEYTYYKKNGKVDKVVIYKDGEIKK